MITCKKVGNSVRCSVGDTVIKTWTLQTATDAMIALNLMQWESVTELAQWFNTHPGVAPGDIYGLAYKSTSGIFYLIANPDASTDIHR